MTSNTVLASATHILKLGQVILCWRSCGGKETLIHCWWGCELEQPLWNIVCRLLKIFSYNMTQQPLFWVSTPKIWKHLFPKTHAPCVHCSIIHSDQNMGTEVSFDRRLDKEGVVHTYSGTLLGRKMKYCHL